MPPQVTNQRETPREPPPPPERRGALHGREVKALTRTDLRVAGLLCAFHIVLISSAILAAYAMDNHRS